MAKVALIDDHRIFCDSLASLINGFGGFTICWTAQGGKEAIEHLKKDSDLPDIILLDINMPDINGIEVAKWVFDHKKDIRVLALTMEEDDTNVIQMLKYGVKGYLLKNIGSEELLAALRQVVKFGYYYTPIITQNIHKQIHAPARSLDIPELNNREKELLGYFCTDMNYLEIAQKIFLSESTVDTYRARLFEKFEVKNRVGLILKAVSLGMVKL
jgi:two-component system, NarL family, invasion response regulator UvrY